MATTATFNLATASATPEATKVTPYFDDYSEDKNFHRVLFKPGVAVQSRELTQSQTILQNQIKNDFSILKIKIHKTLKFKAPITLS